MQKIKKKTRIILSSLLFLSLVLTFLIFLTYNLDRFYYIFGAVLEVILIGLIGYFYINPNFLIKKHKEIILLIVTILLIFILFEVFLRITECSRHYQQFSNQEVKYKHEPNQEICNYIKDKKTFHAYSNSQGFIDDEFVYKEEDYNIFLLGDSFAQCLQSNYSNCVHQRLEKNLREDYNESLNIFNFGIGGYGTMHEFSVLKEYYEEYKPKLVILYFLPQNDVSDNLDYLKNVSSQEQIKEVIRKLMPKSLIFFTSRFRTLINNLLLKSEQYRLKMSYGNQAIKDYQVYLSDYNSELEGLWEEELKTLEDINNFCISRNITLLIVIVTSNEQVYEEDWARIMETYPSLKLQSYNLTKPNSIISEFAEEDNISYIDLLPLFKQNQDRLHWEYDGHWNDEGQIYASEQIEKYLIENRLIRL